MTSSPRFGPALMVAALLCLTACESGSDDGSDGGGSGGASTGGDRGGPGPDASSGGVPSADMSRPTPDAAVVPADMNAPPSADMTAPMPDAAPPIPDAAAPLADAAAPTPDAAGPVPDAAGPVPDAAVLDLCGSAGSSCHADGDCGAGGRCVTHTLEPDGLCYCAGPRPEQRVPCVGGVPGDGGECCDDTQCGEGSTCVAFAAGYCGGAAPPDINTCRRDDCRNDQGCFGGDVCIPAGAFGHYTAVCQRPFCRRDADCDDAPGGTCRVFSTGCGGGVQFGCHYPGVSPCLVGADCPQGGFPMLCQPVETPQGTACVEEFLPP